MATARCAFGPYLRRELLLDRDDAELRRRLLADLRAPVLRERDDALERDVLARPLVARLLERVERLCVLLEDLVRARALERRDLRADAPRFLLELDLLLERLLLAGILFLP